MSNPGARLLGRNLLIGAGVVGFIAFIVCNTITVIVVFKDYLGGAIAHRDQENTNNKNEIIAAYKAARPDPFTGAQGAVLAKRISALESTRPATP